MTFSLRLFCCLAAAGLLLGCQTLGRDPLLGLTFRVIDDEGRPVEGAQVSFGGTRRPQHAAEGGQGVAVKGLTDAQGLFSGELEVWDATQAGYSVEKPGHYPARQISYSAKPAVRGRWQPWNPTIEVVLKRIKNPVPMYAKRVRAEIPVKGEDVGYDLMAGDWVAPHGLGMVADLVFHGEGEVQDNRNYRGVLTLTVPGEGNGLIGIEVQPPYSRLRLPYEASAEGYQSRWEWRSIRRYNPQTMRNEEYMREPDVHLHFFLRVRTELDAEGRVVRAWYGKIHAPFEFGQAANQTRMVVIFTYYLNPDGTRNLEYDPQRNLLRPAGSRDRAYDLAP